MKAAGGSGHLPERLFSVYCYRTTGILAETPPLILTLVSLVNVSDAGGGGDQF
jgi:hypothetical protein